MKIKYIVIFIKILHISGESLNFSVKYFLGIVYHFPPLMGGITNYAELGRMYIKFIWANSLSLSMMVWLWRVPFSILLHCVFVIHLWVENFW
jgi:hypothetical protein